MPEGERVRFVGGPLDGRTTVMTFVCEPPLPSLCMPYVRTMSEPGSSIGRAVYTMARTHDEQLVGIFKEIQS